MLLPTSMTLMISAAVVSSFFPLRMRPCGCDGVSSGIAGDERHHGDAGLEAGQPERQAREQQQRDHDHLRDAAVLGERHPSSRSGRIQDAATDGADPTPTR